MVLSKKREGVIKRLEERGEVTVTGPNLRAAGIAPEDVIGLVFEVYIKILISDTELKSVYVVKDMLKTWTSLRRDDYDKNSPYDFFSFSGF